MKPRVKAAFFWLGIALLYILSEAINLGFDWYSQTFDINLENLLYTAALPMGGADVGFLSVALEERWPQLVSAAISCIPPIAFLITASGAAIKLKLHIGRFALSINVNLLARIIAVIVALLLLATSVASVLRQMGTDEYISNKDRVTTVYEDYYVAPDSVELSLKGEKKNLLYILAESMETTYISKELGGEQDINYIPSLTELAEDETNVSFSHLDTLGGAAVTTGASWTMGAIFAQSSGIPFAFPVDTNFSQTFSYFAKDVVTLGDILAGEGYHQSFLCGSTGSFGGRSSYYSAHGGYEIKDHDYAIKMGYIPEDYMVWWGYEDEKLFDIAKKELLEISAEEQPFNFTMLTVDTHHVNGYICQRCGSDYDHQLKNVLKCADEQITEFINWCTKQDFFEDTVIVLVGDHFRMDSSLIPDNADRRIYNCFINAQKQPEGDVKNRSFTTLDFFPTILSAMGYEIEGDRLALGTDLFSDTPTLAEELGLENFNYELSGFSQFYLDNFG